MDSITIGRPKAPKPDSGKTAIRPGSPQHRRPAVLKAVQTKIAGLVARLAGPAHPNWRERVDSMSRGEALDAAAWRVRAMEYCKDKARAIYKTLAQALRKDLAVIGKHLGLGPNVDWNQTLQNRTALQPT